VPGRHRVVAEHVDRLAIAVERVARVGRRAGLRALAAAPEDVDLGAQLGSEVDPAHRLADRGPAHRAVVGGERAVLEGGMGEEVGGGHPDTQPRLVERAGEAGDDPVALDRGGAPRHEVVVVQAHAPRAELGQPVHGLDRIERRPRRGAERIAPGVADRPQPEAEAVLRPRRQLLHAGEPYG
jgi:hypothetical protein